MVGKSYQSFWENHSFAVVGHGSRKSFPTLTYRRLKRIGKEAFPVDPSIDEVDGDRTLKGFDDLPHPVDAVVIEVLKEETCDWVEKAADAGIRHVWIHQGRDTPEALELARERGLEVRSGNCAVMYLNPGWSYHTVHKWVRKLTGTY